MKRAITLLLLAVASNLSAKSFYCSFTDEKMGVLQIDLDQKEVKICQYQQTSKKEWKQIESGHGEFTKEFFDNSSYETKLGYKVTTLKREVRFSMPKQFKDGAKINISWSMASEFGPLVSSGHSSGISAYCFYKAEAKPCVADRFIQPKNTPKNFEKLKQILETNEKDWWGERPTFTLVSPNLEEFEVFNLITEQVIEACSFGCIASKKEEIIKNRIKPKLKLGWSLVPVYSNENGIELFKRL